MHGFDGGTALIRSLTPCILVRWCVSLFYTHILTMYGMGEREKNQYAVYNGGLEQKRRDFIEERGKWRTARLTVWNK